MKLTHRTLGYFTALILCGVPLVGCQPNTAPSTTPSASGAASPATTVTASPSNTGTSVPSPTQRNMRRERAEGIKDK